MFPMTCCGPELKESFFMAIPASARTVLISSPSECLRYTQWLLSLLPVAAWALCTPDCRGSAP